MNVKTKYKLKIREKYMTGKLLPIELMPTVGKYLAQAHCCRCLNIEDAAVMLRTTPEQLQKIENGERAVTSLWAQMVVAFYGGARGDKVDGLILRWIEEDCARRHRITKSKHLSLVGEDPRPWERLRIERI